jgi:hypothetical protein
MFVIKQRDNVSCSGRKTRVDNDLANATTCLHMFAIFVIKSFSTQSFNFKLTSKPTVAPQARSLLNAFEVLKRNHTTYLCLPPRLEHARMYANHHNYNALLAYLEERQLGWTTDTAKTHGKRFVEGISKAFFECCPSTRKALNDRHSNGSFVPLRD